MLALLLALACAPKGAAPADAGSPPAEPEFDPKAGRAACKKGEVEACLALALHLEQSGGASREALDAVLPHVHANGFAAQVAALLSVAHPELTSAEERRAAWMPLCAEHAMTVSCEIGGVELAKQDPALAAELWAKGCEQGMSWLCPPASPAVENPVELPDAFRAGLERVGATFRMPAGFHPIPVEESVDFQTEFAILSEDGSLEIRYGLRDDSDVLAMIDECKGKPGCISAAFTGVEVSMSTVALANVGRVTPDTVQVGAFPPLPVRLEFNAHWGIVGAVRANPAFAADEPVTTLGFLHQDPAANLYIFWMAHDLEKAHAWQEAAFHALRFTRPPGLGGGWL